MRYGPFEFDSAARRLLRLGEPVHLTPKAFDLLRVLIDAAPGVVTKKELHAKLWPNHAVTDATLVSLIKELRRALGDKDAECRMIRTIHRVGYAFDVPRKWTPRSQSPGGLLLIGPRRVTLSEHENLIGRNPSCTVCIDDATVSRRHARIFVQAGRITLEDLGSKNGTRIGGRSILDSCELHDGDAIQFGDVDAVFRQVFSSQRTVSQVRAR
jgi:DNA-binding winged helix-turn-helix (wHTH) protein